MLITIKVGMSILIGFLAGMLTVYTFNKMPASWLCDYGEKPRQELTDPYVQRLRGMPWRWVYAVGFIALCLRLSLAGEEMVFVQLAVAGLFACWTLLIIAIADLKYMIIPDQFVILLALVAVGFAPFYLNSSEKTGGESILTAIGPDGVWQPVIGMCIGGGFMLMVAGVGSLIARTEVLGFGDVKLCAAMGLLLGPVGTIVSIALATIASGIVSAVGLIVGGYKLREAKPLGPYLCGSAIAFIFVVMPLCISA